MEQLVGAVQAVFASWDADNVSRYREIKGLCHSWHTAVIVQEMAFGNRVNPELGPGMDETRASLTGVVPRSRPTDLGLHVLEGEFKFSAAGDDLVGGVTSSDSFQSVAELRSVMPRLEQRLTRLVSKLRRFQGTDQEVEFTVDRGILSVLQARSAQTGTDQPADRFVEPGEVATRGLGIRGGAFRGLAAFDETDLAELAATHPETRDDVDGVLMILENPTPEDIPMILSADGLLTTKGGSTSHAAVAAHGVDDRYFYAVMSAKGLRVDACNHQATILGDDERIAHTIRTGDVVSIHGTTGAVYVGTRAVERRP
jgi:pyruvate,orthophosphate dikinase